jgi:hypothetical protein
MKLFLVILNKTYFKTKGELESYILGMPTGLRQGNNSKANIVKSISRFITE